MKISIASDHGGLALKKELVSHIEQQGHTVFDRGTDSDASVDYPDFAQRTASDILDKTAERGILICGTGIGMSMAANRFSGIRAALVHSVDYARLCREHNNANILVLGGRFISPENACECCDIFLTTEYEGGRHDRRLEKIENNTFQEE